MPLRIIELLEIINIAKDDGNPFRLTEQLLSFLIKMASVVQAGQSIGNRGLESQQKTLEHPFEQE